jgi:hypothetical protein
MVNGGQLNRTSTGAVTRHEYLSVIRIEGLPKIFYPRDTLGHNTYPPIGALHQSTFLDKPHMFFALSRPKDSLSSLCINIQPTIPNTIIIIVRVLFAVLRVNRGNCLFIGVDKLRHYIL